MSIKLVLYKVCINMHNSTRSRIGFVTKYAKISETLEKQMQ